jgi:peptidoglycan hydrolase-like protein with peptidoglycan-binding domain
MLNKVFIIFLVLMLGGCVTGASRTSSVQTNQVPATPLTTKSDIKSVQESLKYKGFNPGPVDGFMGKKTSNAIRQFQKAEGYRVDGFATTRLLGQLKPGYASSQRVSYNDKIVGQSTVESAAMGGVAGAILGGVIAGKRGALIGAGVGAAAGAGTDVAANAYRVKKAKSEHQLNISIYKIRLQNEELRKNINDAKNIIKEDKTKIQQIKQQLEQQTLTKKQAQKEYKQLDKNRKLLQTTYDNLVVKQKERQKYANAPGATKETIYEINRLNEEIASLRTQLDELDQLRSISITG